MSYKSRTGKDWLKEIKERSGMNEISLSRQ